MNNPNKEIKAQGSEKRRLPIIVICAVVVAIVTAILCFTLIPNKDGETEKQETPSIETIPPIPEVVTPSNPDSQNPENDEQQQIPENNDNQQQASGGDEQQQKPGDDEQQQKPEAIPGTPGVIYELSPDGTYYMVSGYEGTSTEVQIASEHEGKPVKMILSYAFKDNRTITAVVIPNGIESIGAGAFYDCSSLTSIIIPDSITSIEDATFSGCSKLSSLVIPDSVTSIGSSVFYQCSSLNYNEYQNGKYFGIGGNPYAILLKINDKTLSNYVIHQNTKIISGNTFYGCNKLVSITIPDSVVDIGDETFRYCTALTTVTMSASVKAIGVRSFEGCSDLSSITLPDGLTTIGSGAFRDCSDLTSINIPASVTRIGSSAFQSCGLENVYITDIAAWCKIDFSNSSANPLYGGTNLFINGALVTDIVLPENLSGINMYAFNNSEITSIVIPKSVTIIAYYAFRDCDYLTDVYYMGTEEEWKSIQIDAYNQPLKEVTIHYNYTPEP